MSLKPTDTTLFKIRRITDGKFLSADLTWSEEINAKILFNTHSVTSLLGNNKILTPKIDFNDLEVVHYVCDPVYQQKAATWQNISETKFKKRMSEAKGLTRFLVAIIMQCQKNNGMFMSREGIPINIEIDEKGWVELNHLINAIKPISEKISIEKIKDAVLFSKNNKFNGIVFDKEEEKIKITPKEKYNEYT